MKKAPPLLPSDNFHSNFTSRTLASTLFTLGLKDDLKLLGSIIYRGTYVVISNIRFV
jgi:hypothetical protein